MLSRDTDDVGNIYNEFLSTFQYVTIKLNCGLSLYQEAIGD